MSAIEKLNVSVPSELAKAIDRAVTSGDYASSDDVVQEALREWQERRDHFGYSEEELRRLYREGIESGEPEPFTRETLNEIRDAALKRLAREHG